MVFPTPPDSGYDFYRLIFAWADQLIEVTIPLDYRFIHKLYCAGIMELLRFSEAIRPKENLRRKGCSGGVLKRLFGELFV